MKETTLVSGVGLTAFCVAVLAAAVFSFPSDYELGTLYARSFQNDRAIPLLRQVASRYPENPAILRQLMEALENVGMTEEAIQFARRLVTLRPKNESYWNKLIKLLDWSGQSLAALQVREEVLKRSDKSTREDLLTLAHDYEWLQANDHSLRVYDELRRKKLYTEEDIPDMFRLYFSMKRIDLVEELAIETRDRGIVTEDIHQLLFYPYIDLGMMEKAAEHAALYMGAHRVQARRAYDDTRYFADVIDIKLRNNLKLTEDLVWLYAENKRAELALRIFERLSKAKLLSKKMHFSYIDTLLGLKQFKQGQTELLNLTQDRTLSLGEWKEVAQRFLWAGDAHTSAEIFEALLKGKWPSLGNKQASAEIKASKDVFASRPIRLATLSVPETAAETAAETVSDADGFLLEADVKYSSGFYLAQSRVESSKDSSRSSSSPIRLDKISTVKILKQLLEAYDSLKDQTEAIRMLETFIADLEAGKIANQEGIDRIELRELLAERYSWANRPKEIPRVLQGIEFESLSPKGKSLLLSAYESSDDNKSMLIHMETLLSQVERSQNTETQSLSIRIREQLAFRYLWDERPKEAEQVLKGVGYEKLSSKGRAALLMAWEETGQGLKAQEYLNRMPSSEKSSLESWEQLRLSRIENRNFVEDFRYSHIDTMIASPSYFGSVTKFLHTSDMIVPANEFIYHSGSDKSPWSLIGRVQVAREVDVPQNIGYGLGGFEYRTSDIRYQLEAGYLVGGKYFSPQLVGSMAGNLWMFDYASLNFTLASPQQYTQALARNGVSESELELYYMERFSRWAELTGQVELRSTHLENSLSQGQGIELSNRLYLGDQASRFHFGPWSYVVFWDSSNARLKPLLLNEAFVLGILGRVFWGGNSKDAYRGQIVVGWGSDFLASAQFESFFIETVTEKLLGDDYGLRFEYDYYTGSFNQAISQGLHLARLGIFKEL